MHCNWLWFVSSSGETTKGCVQILFQSAREDVGCCKILWAVLVTLMQSGAQCSESVIAGLRPTHLSVVAVNLMVQRYLEAEESVCAIDQQKPGLMSFLLRISKMRSQCLQ